MLEEGGETVENMDWKNSSRQTSGPPDSKKPDNASFNKNSKHGGRRRDPGNPRPKNDQAQGNSRRPTPQKSGGLDKRPRARTSGSGRKREEVITDVRAEVGSALRFGNKKTNLNHLLNFTYEPRGQAASAGGGKGRVSGNWKSRNFWSGRRNPRFSKEQFLQANCQFVVQDGRDYRIHAADPDTLVDWDLIEQVRITSHEVPSCPICLFPPTAAKITRCGHIYCWACMLHYLSLGDKPWRKCPICYDAVEPKDLKSVVALETHAYSAGETITLKLMRRERGSTHTLPVSQWRSSDGQPHNIEDDVDVCYAKLLIARSDQVQRIIDAENTALERAMREEGETLDGSFIKAALEQLQGRAELLQYASLQSVHEKMEALNVSSEDSSDDHSASPSSASPPLRNSTKRVVYASAFSDEEEEELLEEDEAEKSKQDVADRLEEENDAETSEEGVAEKLEEQNDAEKPEKDIAGKSEEQNGAEKPEEHVAKRSEELPVKTAQEEVSDGNSLLSEGDGPRAVTEPSVRGVSIPTDEMSGDGPTKKTANKMSTEYYFYQAEDGQHIYLHSLNARCLVHTFGSWENCPDEITAKIIELEGFSMNQDIRGRLRYLSHLPLTREFQVAELELQPPSVSEESLKVFKLEIEKRKRNRRKKERDDKRLMKKMEADERKKLGMGPGLRVSLENTSHFPQYHADDYPTGVDIDAQTNSTVSSDTSTPVLTPVGSPGGLNPNAMVFVPAAEKRSGRRSVEEEESQQSGGLSFAQMLQSGKAKPVDAWAKMAGSQMKTTPQSEATYRRRGLSQCSEDSDPEDRVPVPVFQNSFGDAIQEALNRHMKKDGPGTLEVAEASELPAEGKGKKKKKVKKLLFTTSMARTK